MIAAPWFVPEAPGAIGLVDGDPAIVHLRLDEEHVDVLPSDSAGSLVDLDVAVGAAMPPIVEAGFTGRARAMAAGRGLVAVDAVPGSSLATRDVTVEFLIAWDLAGQFYGGQIGTVVARGAGGVAAEYVAYAVELRAVSPTVGELRFVWQDIAGTTKTQTGGQFTVGPPGSFAYFAAVRRWVSQTEVVLDYYAGGELLASVASVDGVIGGGTTGTFQLGTRFVGPASRFLVGVLDEVRITRGVKSQEEIAATWDRLVRHQPEGVQMIRQLAPAGSIASDDPATDVQRLNRIIGQSLGYARAQIEDFRRNITPARAYGRTLAAWERITKSTSRVGDSIERRRARVLSRFRSTGGSSPGAVQAALAELLQQSPADVEILAFSNRRTEGFATLDEAVWRTGGGGGVAWGSSGTTLDATAPNGSTLTLFDGVPSSLLAWGTCLTEAQGDARDQKYLAKLIPSALPNRCEAGICLVNEITGDRQLFGLRNTGGVYSLIAERFIGGVSAGAIGLVASTLAPRWMWIDRRGDELRLSHSPVDPQIDDTQITTVTSTLPGAFQYVGQYVRTFGGVAAGVISVSFDDVVNLSPHGDRPFQWYVYRDPADPGVPDMQGAEQAVRALRQSHTQAHAITERAFAPGDADSFVGVTPLGAV